MTARRHMNTPLAFAPNPDRPSVWECKIGHQTLELFVKTGASITGWWYRGPGAAAGLYCGTQSEAADKAIECFGAYLDMLASFYADHFSPRDLERDPDDCIGTGLRVYLGSDGTYCTVCQHRVDSQRDRSPGETGDLVALPHSRDLA